MADSWFQNPQDHRWTLYSDAGGVAKEIDHVLVDSHWEDNPKLQSQPEYTVPQYQPQACGSN